MKEKNKPCHICGKITILTKEHVPPRSAFNRNTAIIYTGDELIKQVTSENFPWDFSDRRGNEIQGGIGYRTLCASCNGSTGAWYGGAFADFTKKGSAQILGQLSGTTIKVKFKEVYPLRVIKQAICMFLSVNRPDFVSKNLELRDFVLDKNKRALSEKYKVYIYGFKGRLARVLGRAAKIDNTKPFPDNLIALSEISVVPFGYVLQEPPMNIIPELVEILEFGKYDYYESMDLEIEMPIMEANSFYPLDFRVKEDILKGRQTL